MQITNMYLCIHMATGLNALETRCRQPVENNFIKFVTDFDEVFDNVMGVNTPGSCDKETNTVSS